MFERMRDLLKAFSFYLSIVFKKFVFILRYLISPHLI